MSADMDDDLTEEQFHRYARHLILDEVGDEGQARLLASKVLVIGAGGLGAPVALYLAAAGVGTLGLVDDDTVDLTNLQRQIIHTTEAVGTPKLASALARLRALNPGIDYRPHGVRLTAENAEEIIAGYDLVVDGSDNFTTRYLANDLCHRLGKTRVWGALLRFEGQLSVFRSGVPGHEGEPCYRCLFREPPDPSLVPRCEEAGILGAVAGVIGTLQATEVLKELLGLGDSLSGRLLLYDALGTEFRTVRFKKDPTCPTCGG
jgi:molybdopterin/thiamine biosynthesis adenylyltransferase